MGARLAATAVCLLAAVVVTPAAAAPAKGGFHRLLRGTSPGPVLTDGRRWAAYLVDGEGTRVADTRTGTSYTVSTPEGCRLGAVGHAILMWECSESRGAYPVLFDMVRREQLPVTGIDAMFADVDRQARDGPSGPQEPAPYSISFDQVGQSWVGGLLFIDYGYHAETYRVLALNWRTGELRYDRPANAHSVPNFDSPALEEGMCSPLARTLDDYDQGIFLPYEYQRPYGVRAYLTKLFLERCGHPATVLARCGFATGCATTFQLGARRVTWATNWRAFLYDIARKRRVTFSQPGFHHHGGEAYRGYELLPRHTGTSLFVSVPIWKKELRWRIFRRGI